MFVRKSANAAALSRSDPGSRSNNPAPVGGLWKRVFDLTLASILIILMFPLLAFVALMIIAFDGKPFFIRHSRIGRAGSEFPCLKFRTMAVNAEEVLQEHLSRNVQARKEWLATRKLRDDPRITSFGQVLRSTSVDELPQLINIIKGEMSFVGPRPIVRDETPFYGPYFADYTKARPGLTGLWQISGRSDTSYDTRVRLDHDYIVTWSFWVDLWIIAQTIPAVLAARGAC
jgi:exopolysaccharide production protein ExoY